MMGPVKLNSHQDLSPTDQTWSKKDLMMYDKKLKSMKKYAPFLDKVVRKLEKNTIKVRTRHLSAAKAFHSLLTESTIRIRLENLLKLDKLLKGLFKNKHKLKIITRSEKAKIINRRKARLIALTQLPSSENIFLCPICKGFKKLENNDSCFACHGVGKLTETISEKWWNILHQRKCDPNSSPTHKNWPKSIQIDNLPKTWNGETSDIETAEKRQEFWDEKLRDEIPPQQKSVSLILCPVCKGFKIIRGEDECFACKTEGKLEENLADEWWEIMFNIRCGNTSNTSSKWPTSVNINCLPTAWKGNEVENSIAGLRQEFWDEKLKEFKKNNNNNTPKKDLKSEKVICPVCKGCKTIRRLDKCFACNGDGKMAEGVAEDWWEVMYDLRCNTNASKLRKKWPPSTAISSLPPVWKGSSKEVDFAKKRCQFWEQKAKDFRKSGMSDAEKRRRLNKNINRSNRTKIDPKLGNDAINNNNLQTRIWLPMVYQSNNVVSTPPQPSPKPPSILDPNLLSKWATNNTTPNTNPANNNNFNFAKPMDTVLPPDESDLHLCPVCRGHSNLSNFRICLACNGRRRIDRATAANWWQRVMRSLSDIEFAYEERALPYNLNARHLPMEWVGTPDQIKAAKDAEIYWRQVKNQWHWQAKMKSPLIKETPPLTIANVSLQPSAEQHLVGLFPNASTNMSVFNTVAGGLRDEKEFVHRMLNNMSRRETNECFEVDGDIPQTSQFTPRKTLLKTPPRKPLLKTPPPQLRNLPSLLDIPPQQHFDDFLQDMEVDDDNELEDDDEPRDDQILLCSFCRGNRFVKDRPCPACVGQGMMTRIVAQKWWQRIYDFRTRFVQGSDRGERIALPDGLKWMDLPCEWLGEGSLLRSSKKLGNQWEMRIKETIKKHKRGKKKSKRVENSEC